MKSEASPVVKSESSDTLTVHAIARRARDGSMLVQTRLEAVVGLPNTTNDGKPLVRARLPFVVRAVIVYAVEITEGVVENVNVAPPSAVVNDVGETVALNAKSEAMPVVAPVDPETLMVQTTAAPIRAGLVFKQDKRDAVVGLP